MARRETQPTRHHAHAQRPPSNKSPSTSVLDGLRSSHEPLPAAHRQSMGARFGHDFSNVRVHDGREANRSAGELAANAFTVGNDIVFGEGQYAPDVSDGERLLAHELTHVVQQDQGDWSREAGTLSDTALTLSHPTDVAEREAVSAADAVVSGSDVSVSTAPVAAVSRDLMDWVSDAASAVGGAVSGAASAGYNAFESATDVKPGLSALSQGVDWVENAAAKGSQGMVDQTKDIPVLGTLAKGAAWVSDETTQAAGGVVKGAGDIAGGLAGAVLHPVDAAAGMEGMLEHNSTVPFLGSTLKAVHGAYDLAANDGGQYGNSWGDLANHVFNPLQQSQDDTNYDLGLAQGVLAPGADGWKTWQDKPAEALARAVTNIAPMLMGGEEGAPEQPKVPEPIVDPAVPPGAPGAAPRPIVDPLAKTQPVPQVEPPPPSSAPDTIPGIPAIPRGAQGIEQLAEVARLNGMSVVELLMKLGRPIRWV